MNLQLAHLIIKSKQSNRSGMVLLENGSKRVGEIFLKAGDIAFSSSDLLNTDLLEYLFESGKINFDEFNRALHLHKELAESTGDILLKLGYIGQDEIELYGYVEACKRVRELLAGEDAGMTYRFLESADDGRFDVIYDTYRLLYDTISGLITARSVGQLCPPLDAVLNVSEGFEKYVSNIPFEEAGQKVISLINGEYSLKIIMTLSPLSDFKTLRLICTLIFMGLITVNGQKIKIPEVVEETAEVEDGGEPGVETPEEIIKDEESVVHSESPDSEIISNIGEETPGLSAGGGESSKDVKKEADNHFESEQEEKSKPFTYIALLIVALIIVVVYLAITNLGDVSDSGREVAEVKEEMRVVKVKEEIQFPQFREDMFKRLSAESK